MRRFIAVLVVVLMCGALFAYPFSFEIGATGQAAFDDLDYDQLKDVDKISVGAQMRLKVFMAYLDVSALSAGKGDGAYRRVNISAVPGLAFDLADAFRISCGVGPEMALFIDDDGKAWIPGEGTELDSVDDFKEKLQTAPFIAKCGVDCLLLPFTLGVSLIMPTEYTLENSQDIEKLVKWNSKDLRAGVSCLFALK